MKSHVFTSGATLRLVGMLLLAALFGGCLEKRIVWSPDGARAAVIAKDGLYLCDGDGRLSDLQVPGVGLAVWAGDSRHLILVRRRETKVWEEVASALGGERAQVEREVEEVWGELRAGASARVVSGTPAWKRKEVRLLLLQRHGTELSSKSGEDLRPQLEETSVTLFDLLLAKVDGGKVAVDRPRLTGLGSVIDLRPDREGTMLAYTLEMSGSKATTLVLRLDDSSGPVTVATETGGYPDWTADGRGLVYIQAQPSAAQNAIELGVLARRDVRDGQGRFALAEKPDELAGTLFNPLAHVRCLKDGRILFNAPEISLPLATADFEENPREQLFVCDPSRRATLARVVPRRSAAELPQALSFFEVSPDESQVVFGGMKGEVALLTLATGDVTRIQTGADRAYHGVPTWRRPGEFTYVRRMAEKADDADRPAEVILRTGETETLLSRTWPSEVLRRVAERNN